MASKCHRRRVGRGQLCSKALALVPGGVLIEARWAEGRNGRESVNKTVVSRGYFEHRYGLTPEAAIAGG